MDFYEKRIIIIMIACANCVCDERVPRRVFISCRF